MVDLSDTQHIATNSWLDLIKYNRHGIPAICMNTDPTLITACSNDFHFNDIFKDNSKHEIKMIYSYAFQLLGILKYN